YILRIFKFNKSVNISREFEYKVQKKAFLKKISSKVYYFDKKEGFLISSYIKGIHKNSLRKKDIKQLAKVLKKIHTLKIKSKKYNFYNDLKYYTKKLKDNKNIRYLKKLKKELKKISLYKKQFALCHHDLNTKNIIFTNNHKIKVIDWEYAGVNDIYFDLATICVEFNLSKQKEQFLLEKYFKLGSLINKNKLKSYKKLYILLCSLWFSYNI
ncbi:choline/ethanolamine kinase family protein, partial [Arcobacter sp. CECT 8985]|uniref:choline/ethanolamine kinase family protein n=1 Tax=Arcobacter sp. CECT 8985 TaxID=1935424 RepID=UPI00100BAB7B